MDGIGTTKYTYSAAGQLLTEDGPFAGDIVTSNYANRLRVALSLQQPTGSWTNGFGYDITRRLTNVISSAGSFGYVYDPSLFTHHPSRIALPNSSYITNAFDGNARLTSTALKNSLNAVLDSYSYVYNPANQRTNLTRADSSTVAFKYDSIGQLTIANSSVNAEDRSYTYDAGWNLHYRTNNGSLSTFIVDNKNELTNAFSVRRKYDTNGNMTNSGAANDIAYTYDDENRLTPITNIGSGPYAVQFVYDGLGRLRERQDYQFVTMVGFVPLAPVYYIYDGWRVIQERGSGGTPAVSYTRGNDLRGTMEGAGGIGGLLARSHNYSGGNFTTHNYYFADGNGNVTYMLNSSQSMVASYRYDPFGNTISSSGTLADANVYRFSSKEIHANSGMYYYGYRFYDPNLHRWINRDPIAEKGGINLYNLVLNAPVSRVDPLGRRLWYCTIIAKIPWSWAGAKHGYFWNDANNNSLSAADRECGQESCSDSGKRTVSEGDGPIDGNPNGHYADPDHWNNGALSCSAMPSYPGDDIDQFMKDCKGNNPNHKKINDYPWFFMFWTCNDSAACFAHRYGYELPSDLHFWTRPRWDRPRGKR